VTAYIHWPDGVVVDLARGVVPDGFDMLYADLGERIEQEELDAAIERGRWWLFRWVRDRNAVRELVS